jgi:hypothetical protein
MNSFQIHARLAELHSEWREAEAVGLTGCAPYMHDLEAEIGECREALVAARVTEIACARAELWGPLNG